MIQIQPAIAKHSSIIAIKIYAVGSIKICRIENILSEIHIIVNRIIFITTDIHLIMNSIVLVCLQIVRPSAVNRNAIVGIKLVVPSAVD